jgi:hypothetical protein
MAQKMSPHQSELYRRVDEILHYLWDPIGVAGVPEARDEYTSYASPVFSLLVNLSENGEIANYLNKIEGEWMGLSVSQKTRDRAVEIEDMLKNCKEVIYERAGIEESNQAEQVVDDQSPTRRGVDA